MRASPTAALFVLAMTACRRDSASTGHSPSPAGPSSTPAQNPSSGRPLPTAPQGADATWAAIAASICDAAFMIPTRDAVRPPGSHAVDVGCRSHPPFARPEQRFDGTLAAYTGDPLAFCAIDAVYRGSFTKREAREAIVSFGACKDGDTWDTANAGSAVLVSEAPGGRWQALDHQADVNIAPDRGVLPVTSDGSRAPWGCDRIRRADGRDALFCASNLGAPRIGSVSFVFVVDFTQKPPARTLARIFGDFDACGRNASALRGEGLAWFQLGKRTIADRNDDGTPDVFVDVTRSRAAPSAALAARVKAGCAADGDAGIRQFVPPAKEAALEFTSAPEGWAVTPTSKAMLDAWAAERPSGFGGLERAGPPDR